MNMSSRSLKTIINVATNRQIIYNYETNLQLENFFQPKETQHFNTEFSQHTQRKTYHVYTYLC